MNAALLALMLLGASLGSRERVDLRREGRQLRIDARRRTATILCTKANLFTSIDFSNASIWQPQGIIASAPTVTTGKLAPDGTSTAYQTAFAAAAASSGATSGIFHARMLTTDTYTVAFWVKGTSGSGSIRLLIYDGTLYPALSVPFTTGWTKFAVAHHFFGNNDDVELGFSDAFSGGSGGPATVQLWHPQLNHGSHACVFRAP